MSIADLKVNINLCLKKSTNSLAKEDYKEAKECLFQAILIIEDIIGIMGKNK